MSAKQDLIDMNFIPLLELNSDGGSQVNSIQFGLHSKNGKRVVIRLVDRNGIEIPISFNAREFKIFCYNVISAVRDTEVMERLEF